MANHDKSPQERQPLMAWQDLPAALGLLTRLPLQIDTDRAVARGAHAAWAWPLVGVLSATATALVGALALSLSLPPLWAASLAVLVQVVLTGALHEDGLADTADGLWGASDPARRLEIMKDSRIGAYGVLALVLACALRITALAAILPQAGALWVLLVVGVISRVPMVVMMAGLPNARQQGLSRAVGTVAPRTALLALGIALACTITLTPWAFISLVFWVTISALALAALAQRKIGGQTGDILGASQQVAEIAALAVFATLLA